MEYSFITTTATSVTVDVLEVFTEYSFRVYAASTAGSGPFSQTITATTLQDVPSAPPADFAVTNNVSSTAIGLIWGEVPIMDRRGIITEYTIRYRQLTFVKALHYYWTYLTVPASNITARLSGLHEFTIYYMQISAATSVGSGPFSVELNKTTLEDVPSASPRDVDLRVLNSTSVSVMWRSLLYPTDENGIITHFDVEYSSILTGPAITSVPANELYVELSGLEEYTEYSVRVAAATSVGAGPFSSAQTVTTLEDVPSAPPATVVAVSLTQSSVQVAWAEVPEIHRNGIITMYEIEYWQKGDESNRSNLSVNSDVFLHILDTLEDFQTYVVRVRAYTVFGPGPFSEPSEARPDQDAPSAAPLNVTSHTLSSTSIQVMWGEVPAVERNGIITHYEVENSHTAYSDSDISSQTQETVDMVLVLVDLHEYTKYYIRVRAYTIEGPGPYSNQTASLTLQEHPTAAPQNVRVSALSSTSLSVSWDPVPLIDQNGIITVYDVEYSQSTFLELPSPVTVGVDGTNMSATISGLEEYVEYSISVAAYTVIGEGPFSLPVQETTLQDNPSGYPPQLVVTMESPSQVVLQWGPVPEREQNGVITHYEVVYTQNSIGHLPQSGTESVSEMMATVGPLQPFIPYNLTVRAFTIGAGPFNPAPITVMTDPSGLTLSISSESLEVREGEDMNIVCTPSSASVGLEWELPDTVVSNEAVVQYREPLRHTLTIRRANIKHTGVYTCRVAGDQDGIISTVHTTVKVLEKCFEDFTRGLFWSVAYDGDTVAKPCRNVDERFSPVVKVYRRCEANRRWTSVDFSGCVLSSSEQQVLVIISLQTLITTDSSDQSVIESLHEELEMITQASGGSTPATLSLIKLPQTLNQLSLLVWKVSYTTKQEALSGQLDSVFCTSHNFTFGSSTVDIVTRPDTVAVIRSDFCECRPLDDVGENEASENSEDPSIIEECLGLNIQELCNGTIASPCNCQASQQCQCATPYVGDGSLCVLDSDGDGYPDQALRNCSTDDQSTYCSPDTCQFAPNHNQEDRSPCIGDETDCREERDSVWGILWPFTPGGETAIVSCGVDFVGNATRMCRTNLLWEAPNVTDCQSRVFVDIMERAEEALESEDTEVVLEVVEELVVATSDEETPQLPRDLNTTNEIITETLDLLFTDLDTPPQQNATNITVEAATVVFEALDNILSESNQASFDSLQEVGVGSQSVLMNAESFGLFAARVLAMDQKMEASQTINITGENMALRAQAVVVEEDTGYSFPSPEEIKGLALPDATLANISLSPSFLASRATDQGSQSVVVASVLFATLQSFLPSNSSGSDLGETQSLIISTQIAADDGKVTTDDKSQQGAVLIGFSFPTVPARDIFEERVTRCAFWDFGNGSAGLASSGWSAANVTTERATVNGDLTNVQCASSHLTSFAVLVSVREVEFESKALSAVSYIGISISTVCLIFTIIFFISFKKALFTAVHNFVHLNLAISLLAGYLVFALGVELAASNKIGCKAVTAMIQYFFLAAFSWMMCEGVMLYLMLVKVFSTLKNKWWFFLLLGWGIPLPFVAVGLGAFHKDYGVEDITGEFQYCWMSSGDGKYAIWTFVAPMLANVVINVVFLILVLSSICRTKRGQATKRKSMKGKEMDSNVEVAKHILKATVILLPLLGLTWVFGLLAVNENTAVFAWLFTIFNSLQGFFIFFFHVLRNKNVSTRLKKRYSTYSSTVTRNFGTLTSTLRRSRTSLTSSSRPSSLSFSGSRTSSILSEAESEFKRESIIVQSPLPVIYEGKEIELTFSNLTEENEHVMDDDSEEEESVFGPTVVESTMTIEVNPGAISDD